MEDKLEQRRMGVRGEVNLFGLEQDCRSFMKRNIRAVSYVQGGDLQRQWGGRGVSGRGTSMCWEVKSWELCSTSWAQLLFSITRTQTYKRNNRERLPHPTLLSSVKQKIQHSIPQVKNTVLLAGIFYIDGYKKVAAFTSQILSSAAN